MTTLETSKKITTLIGNYLVENAQNLYVVECSDLFENDITIRIKRIVPKRRVATEDNEK